MKRQAYRVYAAGILSGAMFSLATSQPWASAGSTPGPNAAYGPWGAPSKNLELSISSHVATFRQNQPIWIKVYLRNLGPEILVTRPNIPSEFQVTCVGASIGTGCTRRPSLLHAFSSTGDFDQQLDKGAVYATSIDLNEMYTFAPGHYLIRLTTAVRKGNPSAATVNSPAIATLESNGIYITVVK